MSSTLLVPARAAQNVPKNGETSGAAGRDPCPHRWLISAMLFVSLAAVLLLVALEWEHYRRVLKSREIEATLTDRVIVGWLLWSKSVLPLVPVMLLGAVAARYGRKKLASTLLYVGAVALYFWMAADLALQNLTGNHVLDYLPYVYDALTATQRNHIEWAGGAGRIVGQSLVMLVLVIASAALLLRICNRVSHWISGRYDWLARQNSAATCGCFLLFALAAVPAQALFHHPVLLRRLHTAMPVDLSLFVPHANDPSAMAMLLGRSRAVADLQRGVRITSVVPDPAGDDPGHERATLHNFTDRPIDLAGWRLRNREEREHALSGTLESGATLEVVFPAGGLELNNDGDELSLVDPNDVVRHHVKYKSELVKYGSVISFREEEDLDEFLFKLDQGVQAVYFTMRKDILTPRPVDKKVHIANRSLPNVIYLVLESFRESAASPELMRRLDAWGKQGLRFGRHYAGSNSSHLGLFTLLYSRSPLVYYPTVNAGVAPQTTHTLRKSGYELTFITSGDCTNFRKMDRFLNEEHFDHVIIEDGADWRDWPERDRRTLEHVRQAAQTLDRPQFVMAFLMSTHFPYAFPPQADVHQPSGADAVDRNNWRSFDASVLHNRYKNAALHLEEQLMHVIEALDPTRNIIVVTGDHGESMGEDGALAHATRASEVQTRVPLLMVGPGLPQRVIREPTTHSDVLPTLLHALAGKNVPILHAHGHDALGDQCLTEQVMLFPYRWKDPYDLILLRGEDRMQFKIRLDRASVEAYGFCDSHGNLDLGPVHRCDPREAVQWMEAFRSELVRIVQ